MINSSHYELDHLNLLGFVLSPEYIRGTSEWFRRSLTHLQEVWPLLTCQLRRNRFRSYDQVLYGRTGLDKTCNGLETKFSLVFTTRLFMMFYFNRNLSCKNFLRNKSNVYCNFFRFYYTKLRSVWKYGELLLIAWMKVELSLKIKIEIEIKLRFLWVVSN